MTKLTKHSRQIDCSSARAVLTALALSIFGSVAQAATIEVREGGRIQDAVNRAAPGDEILVYPGLYSETVYVDKDDITLRGMVEGDSWPHLDGKRQLNDAILYSGNGFSVEWKPENKKSRWMRP